MSKEEVVLAITTVPMGFMGMAPMRISKALIKKGVAACVTMVTAGSIFRWKGKTKQSAEHILLIKTTRSKVGDLKEAIEELHPYDCPELIVLPVIDGLEPYLDWVREEVHGEG